VGRRVVGEVREGVFYKRLRASHFLRTPPAIAFDVSTLREAERAGACYVEITDLESGRVYWAAISTIWERGFPVNRGHGEQWGLALGKWGHKGESLAEQLPLFGRGGQ